MRQAPHEHRDASGTWRTWRTEDWPVSEGRAALLAAGLGAEDFQVQAQTPIGNRLVFLKGRRVTPSTARRYRLRAALTGRPFPRVCEWHNLGWLRRHLFVAPRPLAAGIVLQEGRVSAQWIATEWMHGYAPWEAVWADSLPSERLSRVERLASTVARLHALDFVHGDLFERNLMVQPDRPQGPVALLDAWSGGPRGHRRGWVYDLACLSLPWPVAWSPELQVHFLETYRAARAQQGRPIRNWEACLRRTQAARTARWQREARRHERYGGDEYRELAWPR